MPSIPRNDDVRARSASRLRENLSDICTLQSRINESPHVTRNTLKLICSSFCAAIRWLAINRLWTFWLSVNCIWTELDDLYTDRTATRTHIPRAGKCIWSQQWIKQTQQGHKKKKRHEKYDVTWKDRPKIHVQQPEILITCSQKILTDTDISTHLISWTTKYQNNRKKRANLLQLQKHESLYSLSPDKTYM